ncbi:hypothetical protein J2751_000084 [Halorubrum alkaliphilum]|uniref:DUF7575 domain-containing protein n=1 Tax=Halorubrum alkaliphilum TaxID=261290 RepID=A0A8T4GC88_9EURY|nr:zinc ribbon domain-containing protein [Halorubrum alkaliphilum]MBP1921101.1 hypothetical protein [Halorubrum alkaliphilum]
MSDVSRRRPWLAVLLAIVISGLGHAYLRRWGRALAWYVAITATLVFVVPDAALDQLFARELPPIGDIGPALVVIGASIVDAYVVAIRNNRTYDRQQRARTAGAGGREGSDRESEFGDGDRSSDGDAATTSIGSSTGMTAETPNESTSTAETPTVDCPHCGRETDPEIDFCHWCTEPLDRGNDA